MVGDWDAVRATLFAGGPAAVAATGLPMPIGTSGAGVGGLHLTRGATAADAGGQLSYGSSTESGTLPFGLADEAVLEVRRIADELREREAVAALQSALSHTAALAAEGGPDGSSLSTLTSAVSAAERWGCRTQQSQVGKVIALVEFTST